MNESTPDTVSPTKQAADRIPAKRPQPLAGMRPDDAGKPVPIPGQSHLDRVLPERLGRFRRTISADERRRRQMERGQLRFVPIRSETPPSPPPPSHAPIVSFLPIPPGTPKAERKRLVREKNKSARAAGLC